MPPPLVIGILADLAGRSELAGQPLRQRRALTIDSNDCEAAIRHVVPSLALQVPCTFQENMSIAVELQFGALSDFDPASIVRQVEPLQRLAQAKVLLAEALHATSHASEAGIPAKYESLPRPVRRRRSGSGNAGRNAMWSRRQTPLDEIIDRMPAIDLSSAEPAQPTAIEQLQIELRGVGPEQIDARIRKLDVMITSQVDAITSHRKFEELSNTWHWLCVVAGRAPTKASIRALHTSQDELLQSSVGLTRDGLARPVEAILRELFGSSLSDGTDRVLFVSPALAEGEPGRDVFTLIESLFATLGIPVRIGGGPE